MFAMNLWSAYTNVCLDRVAVFLCIDCYQGMSRQIHAMPYKANLIT